MKFRDLFYSKTAHKKSFLKCYKHIFLENSTLPPDKLIKNLASGKTSEERHTLPAPPEVPIAKAVPNGFSKNSPLLSLLSNNPLALNSFEKTKLLCVYCFLNNIEKVDVERIHMSPYWT